jgi:hypothetical protein
VKKTHNLVVRSDDRAMKYRIIIVTIINNYVVIAAVVVVDVAVVAGVQTVQSSTIIGPINLPSTIDGRIQNTVLVIMEKVQREH